MASAAPIPDDDPPADPPAADPPAPPANDPPADPPPADPPADKGADDWRVRMAGDDAKALGYLGKFASEKAFVEASKRQSDELKQGKFIKPLGKEPSEAELKAYRAVFDVPEAPADYSAKLTEGMVIGDDDKPIFDKFFTAMHAANAPAPVVAAAVDAYQGIVQDQDAALAESVAKAAQECEDALREEWGADFRRNNTATESHIGTLPAEVQSALNEGFGGDGIPLKSNAGVRKWLASLALEANPLITVVPGSGANQASAIAEEIAKIEGLMRTDRSAYNKDEAMQARYRELITARDKLPKE